jgi:hypothetical protein
LVVIQGIDHFSFGLVEESPGPLPVNSTAPQPPFVVAACAAETAMSQHQKKEGQIMLTRQAFGSVLGYSVRLMALALALAWPTRARADQTFVLGTVDPGSGTGSIAIVQATPNGDGSFNATSGSLCVLSGPTAGMYDLVPNPNPPFPFFSPSGAFIVDDQLFPGQDPVLDVYGLFFAGNGLEINIWGNGPGSYTFASFNGSFFNLFDSPQVTLVSGSDPTGLIALDQYIISFLQSTGVLSQAAALNLEGRLQIALSSASGGFIQAAINALKGFVSAANALAPAGIGSCLGDVAALAIADLGG